MVFVAGNPKNSTKNCRNKKRNKKNRPPGLWSYIEAEFLTADGGW
jgi:hypothetical protein